MAGAAVGEGAAVPVDEDGHGGGGLGAVDGAGVEAEDLQGLGRALGDVGGGRQGAAQLAHDAGRPESVADDVTDGHGGAAGPVDEVVPVAAHVQGHGGGPVADGGPVVAERARRGQQGLLEVEGHLALVGVGPAQALVDLLELPAAGVDLGLQHLGVVAAAAARAGPDELGDLFHAVQEQRHGAVGGEDGHVDGAPVALVPDPGPVGVLDVVALDGHAVGLPGGRDPFQGGAQVAHAVRRRIVGVVGEDVEEVAVDDLLAGAAGRLQERLVDVQVHQVRGQQGDRARKGVEDRVVVDP